MDDGLTVDGFVAAGWTSDFVDGLAVYDADRGTLAGNGSFRFVFVLGDCTLYGTGGACYLVAWPFFITYVLAFGYGASCVLLGGADYARVDCFPTGFG